ncbi:MAG: type II toxin-antitoxin system ParD family antitoxin [Sumerlaeia bacterium]
MQVTLDPEYEKFVREQLASGQYESPEAVMREALEALRRMKEREAEWIREQLRPAIDDFREGRTRPFDIERIKKMVAERLEPESQKPVS